jgi:hypothetical protein
VDFLKFQKYHGIGQTLVSKTAVIFTPKQTRIFNTRVFKKNHGMVSKLQKKEWKTKVQTWGSIEHKTP